MDSGREHSRATAGDGSILINVDDLQTHYRGVAYTTTRPPFRVQPCSSERTTKPRILLFGPLSYKRWIRRVGNRVRLKKIKERFPNVSFLEIHGYHRRIRSTWGESFMGDKLGYHGEVAAA